MKLTGKSTINILNKKVFRSIKQNYKQYIAIIMISFLAVCLFCGLVSNSRNFEARVDYLYEQSNIADIYVTTTKYDNADYDYISNLPSVKQTCLRSNIPASSSKNNFNLLIYGDDKNISKPLMIDGNDTFAITNSYHNTYKIDIGDTMNFEITNSFKQYSNLAGQYVLEGKENILANQFIDIDFVVSGIMQHPEGVASSTFSDAIVVVDFEYLKSSIIDFLSLYYQDTLVNLVKSLLNFSTLSNQILIKTDNIDQTLEQINQYYAEKEDNNLLMAVPYYNLSSELQIRQDINQSSKLLYIFPVIFFLVSVLIILTTLTQLILKERLQIGAMKAIGISKGKIYYHYMSYGFILCLIGSILGFVVGPLVIPNVMNIKYKLLWDIPSLPISFFYPLNIICIVLILLLSILVSYIVLRNTINLKPVDLLRSNNNTKVRKEKSEHKFNVSLTTRMSLRNIFSNKAKSLMIIIGTMGCTALLVCGFGIMDTLNYGIDLDVYKNNPVPLTISTSISENDIKDNLLQVDGIEYVESLITYPVTIDSNDANITSTINLIDTPNSRFFNFPYGNGGIIINQSLAEDLNVKLGDTVSVIYNNIHYEKEIDYIYESSILSGIYDLSNNYDNPIAPNRYWAEVNNEQDINKIKEDVKTIQGVSETLSLQDQIAYANDLLGSIKNMTNVIKFFAIALCVVVIYNLISLNISERSRDIATMKVIGFRFNEIVITLVKEILILTLIGTTIGLFLGYPLCVATMAINKTNLITFIYHIYPTTYIISFFISILSTIVVELILCQRVKKISMVESLKSVE